MTKRKYRTIEGVKGKVTVFNQEMHDKFDIPARKVLKERLGEYVEDNEDIYGVDMFLKCDDMPEIKYKNIELQVNGKWDEKYPDAFPFIYARKMRYGDDTLFITFNKNFTKILMFDRKSVFPESKRYVKYGREFVNYVKWSNSIILDTDQFTIENIKIYGSA